MGAYQACCQQEEAEGGSMYEVKRKGAKATSSPFGDLEDLWDLEVVAEGKIRLPGGRSRLAKCPRTESWGAISAVSMAHSVIGSADGSTHPGPGYNLEKQREFASALARMDPAKLDWVVKEARGEPRVCRDAVREAFEAGRDIPLIAP